MKQVILLLIFLAGNYSLPAQHNAYSWSIGLRTGATHELDDYLERYNYIDGVYRDPTTSLHQQLFLNKTLGKRQQWMIEANLSYFSHAYKQKIYGTGTLDDHLYTSVDRYHNTGIQVNGRYALYTLKSLHWKHYLGIALNATNCRHVYNALDNDVMVQTSEHNSWHSFLGLEYYGKINLNPRFSIQYNMNYLVTSSDLDILNDINIKVSGSDEPKVFQRINFGFGIGWHF